MMVLHFASALLSIPVNEDEFLFYIVGIRLQSVLDDVCPDMNRLVRSNSTCVSSSGSFQAA